MYHEHHDEDNINVSITLIYHFCYLAVDFMTSTHNYLQSLLLATTFRITFESCLKNPIM